jgi:uncharacterized protein YhbP (UPF0306 family)
MENAMTSQTFDVERVIREYLPQVIHMSLATSVGGKPWVCEVHFAYDNALNLYFRSSAARRHCEELRVNPHVAGNIITQHFLHQSVRGVYFEGVAQQLEDVVETHPAYLSYNARFSVGPQMVQAAQAEGGARFYKVEVSDFYVLDGYSSDPPQKYHLPWEAASPLPAGPV